jgi:hypothetical protein
MANKKRIKKSKISNIEGAGIIDTIKSRLAVFKGIRLDYSPPVREFLKNNGNSIITGLTIYRAPVEKYVKTLANIVSLGKFKAVVDANYDEVYHLFLKIDLNNTTTNTNFSIIIEKNAIIEIKPFNPDDIKNAEQFIVNTPSNLTLNSFLQNAQASTTKEQYFKYDALSTNCQHYIQTLLKSNNLLTPEANQFLYQNMDILKQQLPTISQKIMKGITNIGSLADIVIKGYGLNVNDYNNIGI